VRVRVCVVSRVCFQVDFPDPNGPDAEAFLLDLFKKVNREPKPPITVFRAQARARPPRTVTAALFRRWPE
jgi:hypothetical protein